MAGEQQKAVPFFDYPSLFAADAERYAGIFTEVCARGALILQRDLESFENELSDFTGARFAVGVANCTDALMLALRAAEIGPGDEVLFCSHTMTATAAAIHFVGATPVPVDCGPDHLFDLGSALQAVTDKTKAILPTHLNGRVCEMDRLLEFAESRGLLVFEDAAQALGARYKDRCAGTFGLAGALSFYPAKSLGCFGDGGAVLTNNTQIAERVRRLRDHGRSTSGETLCWGMNSRLDNLQAAFLQHNLKNYDAAIARRRALAARYTEQLADQRNLVLPPPPVEGGVHFDIFQNYEIQAERRDDLRRYLSERGIGTMVQWGGKAVHQIPALNFESSLPQVERLFERCLMLPLNPAVSDADVDYVCSAINRYYEFR